MVEMAYITYIIVHRFYSNVNLLTMNSSIGCLLVSDIIQAGFPIFICNVISLRKRMIE